MWLVQRHWQTVMAEGACKMHAQGVQNAGPACLILQAQYADGRPGLRRANLKIVP